MVTAVTVMYAASGVHWSLNTYTFLLQIRDPVAWATLPEDTVFRWSVITTTALFCNVRPVCLLCSRTLVSERDPLFSFEVLAGRHNCNVARMSRVGMDQVGIRALCPAYYLSRK